MSVMEWRGGIPVVLRESITTTGREIPLGANQRVGSDTDRRNLITSKWMWIRATTSVLRIYFREADFTGDVNYIQLDSATTPPEIFSAPVEAESIWLKAVTSASIVELVAFSRRG